MNTGTTTANGEHQSTSSAVMQGFLTGGVYGAIGSGAANLLNLFPTPNEDLNSNNKLASGIRSKVSDAMLKSGNPYAMAAGAAVKLIGATGGFSDASKGLGGTNDTLNMISSIALPGAGWFTKPIEKYKVSADTKAMSRSYANTLKNNQDAAQNAGGKIIFGRNLAVSKIHAAKANDMVISGIKENADDDYQTMASMTEAKATQNQYAYTGGYSQALARAGKFGMKIEMAKRIAAIKPKPVQEVYTMKDGGLFNFKMPEDIFTPTTEEQNNAFFTALNFDEIPEFQKGGQMNVIPEGNLHARLHHMEDSDKLTQKGVPVVDNKGEQQAEIELNEIIFTLEVTQQLEDMWKSFKHYDTTDKEKDEIAIKAGKLLAKEIMENTEDRTGLINEVQ